MKINSDRRDYITLLIREGRFENIKKKYKTLMKLIEKKINILNKLNNKYRIIEL